ncbi:MAG: hypothetical protein GY775_14385 [Candidatus Scalindua sp.]|nr:hypothetical protein [Candidatus Scalindua sp.]
MEGDKELFSEDIYNKIIDEYFYSKCQSTADYGMIFQRVMKKLNRINQKIELKSKGANN